MAEKKYKVADGSSVIVKGVVLKSGEAIPDGAVTAEAVKQLVAAKLIVEDKEAKPTDDAKKAEAEAKKSGGQQGGTQA